MRFNPSLLLKLNHFGLLILVLAALIQLGPTPSQLGWASWLVTSGLWWLLASLPLWPFTWQVLRPSSRGLTLYSFCQLLFFALAVLYAAGESSGIWGWGLAISSASLITLTLWQLFYFKAVDKARQKSSQQQRA